LLRLAVRVAREQAELVLAELLELAPSGVEEVEVGEGMVEYAVYGAPGELPALPDLRAAAGDALVDVSTREIEDDWDRLWREFHRPVVVGGRLTVRPPWERRGTSSIDLVIDPGQAFGTGGHATTRLCLELMLGLLAPDDLGAAQSGEASRMTRRPPDERAGTAGGRPSRGRARGKPKGPFLDLGCGSGVLAIAAARLGWAPVAALDNDPAAVAAARANARANGVSVVVRRHDLRRDPPAVAPTVAANLLRSLLLAWADRLREAPRLPERVIASGLLVAEVDEVAEAFAVRGLRERERRRAGDWAAILLEAGA
jgi:ribosomal protein L11 methyltransferase